MKGQVPQGILDPILKEAAALAKVSHEQLVIVRAQSVVWNDGSLGCPEPGMMYTQALVNGYWVVIEAAGQKYDFRVGSGGSFRLCPPAQVMRHYRRTPTKASVPIRQESRSAQATPLECAIKYIDPDECERANRGYFFSKNRKNA